MSSGAAVTRLTNGKRRHKMSHSSLTCLFPRYINTQSSRVRATDQSDTITVQNPPDPQHTQTQKKNKRKQ